MRVRECIVLHRTRGVPSEDGFQMMDCSKGKTEWMGNNSEEVEIVAELVSGEEKAVTEVPRHCHCCL